jgi:hypothetical protein
VSEIRNLRRTFEPNSEKRSGMRELHKRELQGLQFTQISGQLICSPDDWSMKHTNNG